MIIFTISFFLSLFFLCIVLSVYIFFISSPQEARDKAMKEASPEAYDVLICYTGSILMLLLISIMQQEWVSKVAVLSCISGSGIYIPIMMYIINKITNFLIEAGKIKITSKKDVSCRYASACICAAVLSYLYLKDISIATILVAIVLGKYIWFIDEKNEKKTVFKKNQNFTKRKIAIFVPIGIAYAATGALAYFMGTYPMVFSGACFGSAAAGILVVYMLLKNEKRLKSDEKESSS